MRSAAVVLVGWLVVGCGSETIEADPDEPSYRYASISVTLLANMQRSCTTQFSVDQDGHPFGEPTALVELALEAGPEEATLFAYHTEEPPQSCPPMADPLWTGPPGQTVDYSDAPIALGPGSAFTLQADCEACVGEVAFKATLKLEKLEEP